MTTTSRIDERTVRDVLGHLPTGVVALTGASQAGDPVGLIVGTFVRVSLNPPLVAFVVDSNSVALARLQNFGAFCANILAAHQEPLCRALAVPGRETFAGVMWHPADSGSPILDDAIAWIDCEIDSVARAGDRTIVIGRVTDLGVRSPTIPLIHYQGGLGGFAPMSLAVEAREDLFATLQVVDHVRAGMEELAVELESDCLAHVVSGGDILVLAAAYTPRGGSKFPRLGFRIPLVPPFAEPFMAWASADELAAWVERLRQDTTSERDVDRVLANVRDIQKAGWAFTVRTDIEEDDRALRDLLRFGHTPAIARELATLTRSRGKHGDPDAFDDLPRGAVRTICAPILDASGHLEIMLALHNLPTDLEPAAARRHVQRLRELTTVPLREHPRRGTDAGVPASGRRGA